MMVFLFFIFIYFFKVSGGLLGWAVIYEILFEHFAEIQLIFCKDTIKTRKSNIFLQLVSNRQNKRKSKMLIMI